MKDLPILGWVCLGFLLFMVLGLYLSLFSAWRRKDHNQPQAPGPGQQIINTLRDPWAREDAEWKKLRHQTEELRKPPPPADPDSSNP